MSYFTHDMQSMILDDLFARGICSFCYQDLTDDNMCMDCDEFTDERKAAEVEDTPCSASPA